MSSARVARSSFKDEFPDSSTKYIASTLWMLVSCYCFYVMKISVPLTEKTSLAVQQGLSAYKLFLEVALSLNTQVWRLAQRLPFGKQRGRGLS